MPEGIPPPLALSLLIADNHLVDHRTQQHSVIGIISHVQAPKFPVLLVRLCVFAELTGARGKVAITFRVVDADESRPPVVSATSDVDFGADPLAIFQFGIGMQNLVFPEPGEYRAQILSGGSLLLERRLLMVPMKPPEQPVNPAPDQGE